MTYAYDETYLSDAMKNLGEAFDYAVNGCCLEIGQFAELFVASGYAEQFGKGNPRVVTGLSGTELVMEVIAKSKLQIAFPEAINESDYSPEYWCGWILAYYQWCTGKDFKNILEALPMKEIHKLYGTLHEASEDKFVDTANAIMERRKQSTKLQRQRKRCGYTQRELSEKSGINLRTLQQYELGTKNINKASVASVKALAAVLGCQMEAILE
ncbi:MAG: helix-turn-helix transcriptional regulator [Clostridiales bacterium]|nr:helix-turn-helix transcriptional regulator [Clostridiales bacterium]